MPTPAISILVPTYNGAAYLGECLDSILAQTFLDFELLIVDDGSTDDTLAIAEAYAKQESRIIVKRNSANLGLVQNWNRCIELTRGQWIKFVFQDDLIAPTCIAEMLEAGASGMSTCLLRARAFVCPRDRCANEFGLRDESRHYRKSLAAVPRVEPAAVIQALLSEYRNFFGEPTAAMLRRSLGNRFGWFNPHLVQWCDYEYWTRVGVNTGIAIVPRKLASFRFHQSSTSAINRSQADFRSGKLDRLLVLHEFAENRHFTPLRAAAARQRPPRHFGMELARKAHWLKGVAERAARDPLAPDPQPLAAWRAVVAHFPQLESSALQLPLRLRAAIDRHVLWRFKKSWG